MPEQASGRTRTEKAQRGSLEKHEAIGSIEIVIIEGERVRKWGKIMVGGSGSLNLFFKPLL